MHIRINLFQKWPITYLAILERQIFEDHSRARDGEHSVGAIVSIKDKLTWNSEDLQVDDVQYEYSAREVYICTNFYREDTKRGEFSEIFEAGNHHPYIQRIMKTAH